MKRMYILPFMLLMILAQTVYADQPNGSTILKNMMQAEARTAYAAHEVTVIGPGNTRSEQNIYRDGSKGSRIEYVSPKTFKGIIIVDDGKQWSVYNPNEKTIKVGPSRLAFVNKHSMSAPKQSRNAQITAEFAGKEKVAGRQAYIIKVLPRQHRERMRKLWVDTEKWIKLRSEEYGIKGELLSKSYYTRINYKDSIPESKFKIVPGPGVKVVQMKGPALIPVDKAKGMVKFRILEPAYLPSGFRPEGAVVMPFRGEMMVGIRYTDGIGSFSIFQTPAKTAEPGFLRRLHEGPVKSGSGVYSWQKDGYNLTIIGRISADEIKRIAVSVK